MISRNNTIKNFWTIFFGVVALIAIAVAVTVGVVSTNKVAQMRMSVIDDANTYKIGQENSYKQSLYLACDSMKNLDANLGKVAVSNDTAHQTEMLAKVVIHANQVNQCLSNLPFAASDELGNCQKFVNQTQDYATYLLGELSSGEKLTASQRSALNNLDTVASNMYDFLQGYAESDSGMFITNGNGQNNVGNLSDSLAQTDSNAFEYEKLIYDGPFSDSVEHKTLKPSTKLNRQQLDVIASELFDGAQFVAQINHEGVLYVYDVDNGKVYLTEDGRVAQYEAYSQVATVSGSAKGDTCIQIAEEFCAKLGYDVKGVWISKTQDTVTYVNCATVKDDVIIYPDIIKVAVDCSGKVVGLEARAYLLNHTDWDVTFGDVSQDTAKQSLDGMLKVTNVAKALVEKNNKHYLCYEFECMRGNNQYYVYVDSVTGNEVQIFKVIQGTEGFTVM
ncbi:MAG: germination protein YpeB [Clostridia bacterium]|nr:germination protein YpeB [Clostridia bacterium]